MPSDAVMATIRQARREAQPKQVWLVSCLDEDDDTIRTVWSVGTGLGDLYTLFSTSIKAYMAPAIDAKKAKLKAAFDSDSNAIEEFAAVTLEEIENSGDTVEHKEAAQKKLGQKMRSEQKKLDKALRGDTSKAAATDRRGGIHDKRTMGAQAAAIRDNVGAYMAGMNFEIVDDEARHAEENFIRNWSSRKNEYESAEREIKSVSLFMNFSPCSDKSAAKTIAEVVYEKGCINKLKTLAIAHPGIQWHIHYDEYFQANRENCLALQNAVPNITMLKLSEG